MFDNLKKIINDYWDFEEKVKAKIEKSYPKNIKFDYIQSYNERGIIISVWDLNKSNEENLADKCGLIYLSFDEFDC